MRRVMALLAGLVAAAGCDLDLERMITQPRYTSYEVCDVCPDGTIMMLPPRGTVPRSQELVPAAVATGRIAGAWVEDVPLPVDREVLERGRNRFDIFCAACHGRLGNGVSQVAENMQLREPPNLLAPPYARYPAGRLYAVVNEGYGLMRSYASELSLADRWAVVAYVQALQLSQNVRLDELPPDIRQEAERWLR